MPATADPNKDRNDPMVPEYWELGEAVQDRIRQAGYEAPTVEGIAVDIHDLLQAADRLRNELGPSILAADSACVGVRLREFASELRHVRWHCDSAIGFVEAAAGEIDSASLASG